MASSKISPQTRQGCPGKFPMFFTIGRSRTLHMDAPYKTTIVCHCRPKRHRISLYGNAALKHSPQGFFLSPCRWAGDWQGNAVKRHLALGSASFMAVPVSTARLLHPLGHSTHVRFLLFALLVTTTASKLAAGKRDGAEVGHRPWATLWTALVVRLPQGTVNTF